MECPTQPAPKGAVTEGSNLDDTAVCGMHQPPSVLDVTDATIGQATVDEEGGKRTRKDAPCIVLPHQSDYVSHIALDIGGSLIKLIYFSMDENEDEGSCGDSSGDRPTSNDGHTPRRTGGGKLHFVKFETTKVEQCMDFIEAKGLHRSNGGGCKMRVKATGGGAYKYSKAFHERLGLILEREDEMACMVDGCNFLLKAVRHEAFMYENRKMTFVDLQQELYPYLLVNIGSGVSMVRVDGEGKFQRVSGTNIGGGTFWGLCRLLTGLVNFDEILELTSLGDNSKVDMLVGDIYGGRDYTGIGLSANTIASSFGKVLHENKSLAQCNPADMALSLCRMISYNIGQLAYLNAKRYNLSRIFFGGFFIRGHPYTMETISFAITFWSKGEMAAHFLRHEGFLGAVGAFMKVQAMRPLYAAAEKDAGKVRARFVERFKMGAPVMGGEIHGPAMHDMHDKLTWVEKFIAVGRTASNLAREEHERAQKQPLDYKRKPSSNADLSDMAAMAAQYAEFNTNPSNRPSSSPRIKFNVGVLQFSPYSEPFALLADPVHYDPNTIDINTDSGELEYWAGILQDQIPNVVEKAFTSEGSTKEAWRRASAFGRALDLHLSKLRAEPGAYGQLGLADLFELREECLREFGFADVYRHDKARENTASLEVLPDLLAELDELTPPLRLLALLQGVLAANIFDWGAKACVDMYQNATILEMYREARTKLSARPWRVDHFDRFAEVWFSRSELDERGEGTVESPYKRVIMFVDNAGADVVLGMLPLARELLKMGAEVVLVANSLPAINDITGAELRSVVAKAAELDPTIRAARDAAVAAQAACNGRIPPYRGMRERAMSVNLLSTQSSPIPAREPVPESMLPAARSAGGFAFCPAPVLKQAKQFQLLGAEGEEGEWEGEPGRHTPPNRLQAATHLPGGLSHQVHTQQGQQSTEQQQQVLVAESPTAALQEAMAVMAGAAPQDDEELAGQQLQGQASPFRRSLHAEKDGEEPRGGQAAEGPSDSTAGAGTGSEKPESWEGAEESCVALGNASSSSFSGNSSSVSMSDDKKELSPSTLPNHQQKGMFGESYPSPWKDPRLYIVSSGHGSPCLDLRRVSAHVADSTVGADLVIIEGMGRAIHTNYNTMFKCDALKLAMIKNKHLAQRLFGGDVYDCVCRYDSPGF